MIKRKELLTSFEAYRKELEREKESLLFCCGECGTKGKRYKVNFNIGFSANFYDKATRFYRCPNCSAEWKIEEFEILWRTPLVSLLILLVVGSLIILFLIVDPIFNLFTFILFIALCLIFIGTLGVYIDSIN